MNDEEFQVFLTKLGERHRAHIAKAARAADEAVERERLKARPSAEDSSRIIRPPKSFWQSKMRFVTGEVARLAATVVLAAGLTFWLVSARMDHSDRMQHGPASDWITRGSTNKSAALIRELLPTGWRRACLAVGVSRFRDSRMSSLPGASADVEAWTGLASETLLIPTQHYLALHDENATEAGLRSALRWLATFDRPNDQIFIYVATHAESGGAGGVRIKLYDSDSMGGISFKELAETFKNSRAQVVLIADVCHAGDLGLPFESSKSNIWILASASREQAAFEMAGARQSVFGAALLEALRGKADANGDGIVTMREAFSYVKTALHERMGDRQTPLLMIPNGKDLVFAASDSLRGSLPPAGEPAPAPAQVQFSLNDSDLCRLTLDHVDLGVARGEVGLTVLPGKHELRVEALTPSFARESKEEPQAWSGTFTAEAGKPILLNVLVRPTRIAEAQAIGHGMLFPTLVRNPESPAVNARWQDDGSLELEFIWTQDAPQKLTALFASDSPGGISIPRLFGLNPNESAELVFEAVAEQRDEFVTFFAGGGAGAESLVSPVRLEATVSSASWKRFSLKLPASDTSRLKVGFGVEVSGGPNRGVVILHIRDVRISKAES